MAINTDGIRANWRTGGDASHNPTPGSSNTSAYLSSGRPWITGSMSTGEEGGGIHLMAKGWDNGASSSAVAGAFRTDGEAASAETAAEIHVKFPYVTKAFEIIQSGSGILRVHFQSIKDADGDEARYSDIYKGSHYIQLDGDEESMKFNIRAKEVYISGIKDGSNYPGFQLFAELTGIPTGSMHQHSGSGITQFGDLGTS